MQTIRMHDDALGNAEVAVSEVYLDGNGTYNFTEVLWVRDLDTGETNDDVLWCETVQEYLQGEGYGEQHVSAQCATLYEQWMAANC